MDERDTFSSGTRRSLAGPALGLLCAFLAGIALTAFLVHRSDRISALLHPLAPVQPVAVVPVRPVIQPVIAPAGGGTDPALTERVDTIEDKVDVIGQRAAAASGDADRAEGLLVAFAARRVLDRGQPLGYLEGMLRQRFGQRDGPSVSLIIAAAQRPVLLAQLQDQLSALRPTLVGAGPNTGWLAAIRRELSGMLVVRHAGTASPAPAVRFARAEHALDQGQVDVAAAEVARMPGAAQAGDWLASARRYVLARNALDQIESDALLAPPPAAPAPPAG